MKRVLVTGANKGIGKAICQELLESHPDVYVILSARDVKRGKQAVTDITSAVPNSADRIEFVQLDVSSDKSVKAAAKQVCGGEGKKLYGIVNNAGLGWGQGFQKTMGINYFGPRRVCDAFSPELTRPGGRIVNIASASGPDFVSRCQDAKLRKMLADPLSNTLEQFDGIGRSYSDVKDYDDEAYGLSKAMVNAFTALYASSNRDLIINSCTPGWIDTDMTKGQGASNPPKLGARCPIHLLLSPEMEKIPSGRYYGSDAVRSPLDRYRGPGEPAYEP